MVNNGYYGVVKVPDAIFEKLNSNFFISHSSSNIKYMCANSSEKEHLQSFEIEISDDIVCDYYRIEKI